MAISKLRGASANTTRSSGAGTKAAASPPAPVTMGDKARRAKAERVLALLIAAYGRPQWEPGLDPLSELVATILSQHTSDANSDRAFAMLRASFRDWEEVRRAPVARIAEAVRSAGLANVKAPRIKETLEYVAQHAPRSVAGGPLSLDFLADLDVAEAKAWLRAIPGVGPKTAACVLMFALNKPALPVDTHVYRVGHRLGLIDAQTSAEAAHEQLEALVASEDIYAFHVNLITHGRRVCKAQQPRCVMCNLREECDYYQGTRMNLGQSTPPSESASPQRP